MRWHLSLSEFDFEVVYKNGRANTQADALSRLPSASVNEDPVGDDILCFIAECLTANTATRLCAYPSDDEDNNVVVEDYGLCDEFLDLEEGERSDFALFAAVMPEEFLREQAVDDFYQYIRHRIDSEDLKSCISDDQSLKEHSIASL